MSRPIPPGALKHRLARSLFLYALCNGWVDEGTTIIEASSGSTAVSEAYFAQMLGLPFVAVVPERTSAAKLEQIAFYGGRCHFVPRAADMDPEARRLALECQGHYMDQFTYAERATDWRGNNNIAESRSSRRCALSRTPSPTGLLLASSTGGTSATIGRYVRYSGFATKLCVVDPEHSAFFDYWHTRDKAQTPSQSSRIEGIGRPQPEPSFLPEVVDRMIRVPDGASLAAMRVLTRLVGRRYGGSTGTNFYGVLQIAAEMAAHGEQGSIVTLHAIQATAGTYYDDAWVAAQGHDLEPYSARMERCIATGQWASDG